SILPAASAQNMKASSASGLCARRMVRLAGTRPSRGDLRRLRVEGVEVVRMLGVFGPLAGALGRLVPEELGVRPARTRRVVPQLQRAGPPHECEEMRRGGAGGRGRLGEGAGVVPAGEVADAGRAGER